MKKPQSNPVSRLSLRLVRLTSNASSMRRLLIAVALLGPLLNPVAATSTKKDLYADSDPGIRIHIREVRTETHGACDPILLVHGARVPGVASFDLSVPGGSLAADLADRGFCVYVMDVRGYGQSTRPPEMEQPPQNRPALVRSVDAVRDIDAAVDFVRKRMGVGRVSLFGWATGGQWAGYYAALHSGKLSHLIVLNALYGVNAPHPLMGHGSDMEDPAHPGHLNPAIGAYRCNSAESLLGAWNRSIPADDKDSWRDPSVADAYVREALASDPEASTHQPPCFRSPSGALEDSFYLATGRQLWDASFIYVPTLVLASERDFWSRPGDRDKMKEDMVHAPIAKVVVIPNATHFVHLDRPEHGRQLLLNAIVNFIHDK
jgi:pimeloyl-ACP methyl ester carboxylesterase